MIIILYSQCLHFWSNVSLFNKLCFFLFVRLYSLSFNMDRSSKTLSCSSYGIHSVVQLMEKNKETEKNRRRKRGVGTVQFNHERGKEYMQRKQRLKQYERRLKHRAEHLKYLFRQSFPKTKLPFMAR